MDGEVLRREVARSRWISGPSAGRPDEDELRCQPGAAFDLLSLARQRIGLPGGERADSLVRDALRRKLDALNKGQWGLRCRSRGEDGSAGTAGRT